MNSGNPIEDAQDYLRALDNRPDELDLIQCYSCSDSFEKKQGLGIIIGGEEVFCNDCIKANNHLEFYRTVCGQSDADILEYTAGENIKEI